MGFQAADLVEFGRSLGSLSGVREVWLLAPTDHEATLYVTVAGFDAEAIKDRRRVYMAIEDHLERVRPEMDNVGFAFNHSVLVDEDEVGEPRIPSGARNLAA